MRGYRAIQHLRWVPYQLLSFLPGSLLKGMTGVLSLPYQPTVYRSYTQWQICRNSLLSLLACPSHHKRPT